MCCGSQSASSGQKITIASTTNMIRWNGIVPYTTSLSLPSQMLWITNRLMPIGGEICPSSMIDHQHDAEQDRIDAVAAEDRKQQRHRDDDHAEAFDQAAEHGEQHEQHEIELRASISFMPTMNSVSFSPMPAKLIA